MQTENREDKFTIEQLVEIGDALHNSKTCIVIIDTGNRDSDKYQVLGAIRGKHKDLKNMLYALMQEDETIYDLLNETLTKINFERLKKHLDNI